MSTIDELLKTLNNTSINKLASKEKTKNQDIEDAQAREIVTQTENRTKFGQFAVNWTIALISTLSVIFLIMIIFYLYDVVQDSEKLEALLKSTYFEMKLFIVKYQAIIAVIATLMFGEKFKLSKKQLTKA